MTRVPAGATGVAALTPMAATVSAGQAAFAALGQTPPSAIGEWSIGHTGGSTWRYRKHLRPIYQTGSYTGCVAAALLDVRASQPGIGPLGVPDLRFGGQL